MRTVAQGAGGRREDRARLTRAICTVVCQNLERVTFADTVADELQDLWDNIPWFFRRSWCVRSATAKRVGFCRQCLDNRRIWTVRWDRGVASFQTGILGTEFRGQWDDRCQRESHAGAATVDAEIISKRTIYVFITPTVVHSEVSAQGIADEIGSAIERIRAVTH